jgi:hypothetical protein
VSSAWMVTRMRSHGTALAEPREKYARWQGRVFVRLSRTEHTEASRSRVRTGTTPQVSRNSAPTVSRNQGSRQVPLKGEPLKKLFAVALLSLGAAFTASAQYGQFPPPPGAIDAVMLTDIPFDLCGDMQQWEFYFADGSIDVEWYYFPNGQCFC